MKTSTVTNILNADDQVIAKRIKKFDNGILDDQFDIPVLDVRRSEDERKRIGKILRASSRGSSYMKPSFSVMGRSYQVSHKN